MQKPVITRSLADKLALSANGSYSNEGNALQHTIYDTAAVPAALGANINYFTQPIGAAYGAGNKTVNETNLQDPGKLPNGQTFIGLAFSVACKFNADTTAGAGNALFEDAVSGWYGFIQNSVFEFVIAGRDYEYQVHGAELVPTVPAVFNGTATAAIQAARIGDYWTSGWVKLNVTPIIVGQMVTFSVRQIQGQQIANALAQVNRAMAALNGQDAETVVRVRGILTRSI